jgi:hypothetical protein
MTGPYAATALSYWSQGWQGILPLPVADKYPPPKGYTGATAPFPSYADVYAWCEGDEGNGNIGIRLPRSVLGIDVDAYAGKVGADTLARLFSEYGPLPQTWRLSSRADGISGIYLFRVPDNMQWPGEAGPHVELIQYRHRYAVAWPSVHPNGAMYRWWQGAALVGQPPAPQELPELPEAWIRNLTRGQLAVDIDKLSADDGAVSAWLSQHTGTMCSEVAHSFVRVIERLKENHSRHDTMARGVMRLVHLGAEGHLGATIAIGLVQQAFLAVVTFGDGARSHSSAQGEYDRALAGAVGVALGELGAEVAGGDPCRAPLGVAVQADPPLSGPVRPVGRLDGPGSGDEAPQLAGGAQGAAGSSPDGSSSALPVPAARPSPQASTSDLIPVKNDPAEMADDPILDGYVQNEILRQKSRRIARELLANEESLKVFSGIEVLSMREDLLTPPSEVPFVVDQILPQDSNVVLTAQYKAGKTTLMINVTRSLVDTVDVLDRYPVHEITGNVAVFNYEVLPGMYREWIRSQNVINTQRILHVPLRGRTLPLMVPEIGNRIVEMLMRHEVHTWIVDPFARALGADENSNEDVSRWLDAFDDIKRRAGVNLGIIVTHTGRAENTADRSRGASRIDDWPDVRWLLTRDVDGGRWFRATGRDVETPEGNIQFNPLTRHLSIKGDETRPVRIPRPTAATDGELMDLVMQTVIATPGISKRQATETVRALRPARTTRLVELMRMMEQQNLIGVVEGPGKIQSLYLPSMKEALERSGG